MKTTKNITTQKEVEDSAPKNVAQSSTPKKVTQSSALKKEAQSSAPKKEAQSSAPKKVAQSSAQKKEAQSSTPKGDVAMVQAKDDNVTANTDDSATIQESSLDRMKRATDVARNKAYWAAGVGVIPIPFVDVAGITLIQLKMIQEIAAIYGTKLSSHLAKAIVTSLLTGIGGTAASYGALGYSMKAIPLVGPILGVATMPAVAGTTTYAVGVVFAAAFEKGDPSLADGSVATTREALGTAMKNSPVSA